MNTLDIHFHYPQEVTKNHFAYRRGRLTSPILTRDGFSDRMNKIYRIKEAASPRKILLILFILSKKIQHLSFLIVQGTCETASCTCIPNPDADRRLRPLAGIGLSLLFWALAQSLPAQIPVEVLAGHERATFDQMFFRFFKRADGQNSPFLFFSRQRAVVDYRQTTTAYLPQFGFTEALSWNHPAAKGFAPVVVGQVLNRGTLAKAGVQYAHLGTDLTVFGWTVLEARRGPSADLFLLGRYTPQIRGALHLFAQVELLQVFPTAAEKPFSFTQRLRLGLNVRDWQWGLAADFFQTGREERYAKTQNAGLFLRHEF